MAETLGEQIKRRRGKALTQGQLADLVGISKSMVSQIEQDKKTPSIPVLQRIAQALDLDMRDLLGTKSSLPSADPDAGIVAIRHALSAAEKGNDELLLAALRGSVSWQLLVSGRYEEAHAVALKAAASVEPWRGVRAESGSPRCPTPAGRDRRRARTTSA